MNDAMMLMILMMAMVMAIIIMMTLRIMIMMMVTLRMMRRRLTLTTFDTRASRPKFSIVPTVTGCRVHKCHRPLFISRSSLKKYISLVHLVKIRINKSFCL